MDIPIRIYPLSVDIGIGVSIVSPNDYCTTRPIRDYSLILLTFDVSANRLAIPRPAGMNISVSVNPLRVDIIITVAKIRPGDDSAA